MKPQRTPSDSLSSPKEFPLTDLTGKIRTEDCGVIQSIYEAQLLTYLRASRKRVGLLMNFNVER